MNKLELKNSILKWFGDKQDDILIIEGPSQIGKTTFIKRFLNYSYFECLYIDVKQNINILNKLLNDTFNNADNFYPTLCFEFNKRVSNKLVTLIFDGIEYCPKLRQFFKSLIINKKINIIAISCGATGPLHYKDRLIPSNEIVYRFEPLTFYEFLKEIRQDVLADFLRNSINEKMPLTDYVSGNVYKLFKIYNLVGGYPSSVQKYIESQDIHSAIRNNRYILNLQFLHAESLLKDDDKQLLAMLKNDLFRLIKESKFNIVDDISIYKMKQLLSFLQEEHVINIATALDVNELSLDSYGKHILMSHQCFFYALLENFDFATYFNDIVVPNDVVLIDYFFNQKIMSNPLNYGVYKIHRYIQTDALLKTANKIHVVEIKSARTSTRINEYISEVSDDKICPGVVLLNRNICDFGKVLILPSYCSCFLTEYFNNSNKND